MFSPEENTSVRLVAFTLCVLAGTSACSTGRRAPDATPPPPVTEDARILSVYHGLDELPGRARALCGRRAVGEDGMPVTFSIQVADATLAPEVFVVETASGERVTPVCATLRPADESLELRTVLLAGPFGTADATPRAVEVIGALEDVHGRSLTGLRADVVTPIVAGPSLVLAERFSPDTPGLVGECPDRTSQVVQLTWQGGVTGPDGAALTAPQRGAISVTLEDGVSVTPIALADDDPDNFVLACIDSTTRAVSVRVAAGFFYDPGDDANPETSAPVIDRAR